MAHARSTFENPGATSAKKDRARAKMDDRQSRREDKAAGDLEGAPTDTPGEVVDQARLLEQFAALHEDLADSHISLDDFEVRQEGNCAPRWWWSKPHALASRPSNHRRNPATLECTPFMMSSFSLCTGSMSPSNGSTTPAGVGDIDPVAVGLLGRLGPLAQGRIGLGQELVGLR